MSVTEREMLAGLRILALTARADGVVRDGERAAIERALDDLRGEFPGLPQSVDDLLAGDFSVAIEEEFLRTDEARARVYEAAVLVANADGAASIDELALIDRLRPQDGEDTLLDQVIGETKDTLLPSSIEAIYDPERRETEVREDILKYAVLAAALGAIPLPGVAVVTDLAVVALQVKMSRDIARYWGHQMDPSAVRSLLGTMTGSVVLRVALNNLARLVPGWGSVYGAATSFASTMAIGEVVHAYFEAGGAVTPEEMRKKFDTLVEQKRGEYGAHADAVKAAQERHGAEVAALAEDLRAGKITRAEYEARIAALS